MYISHRKVHCHEILYSPAIRDEKHTLWTHCTTSLLSGNKRVACILSLFQTLELNLSGRNSFSGSSFKHTTSRGKLASPVKRSRTPHPTSVKYGGYSKRFLMVFRMEISKCFLCVLRLHVWLPNDLLCLLQRCSYSCISTYAGHGQSGQARWAPVDIAISALQFHTSIGFYHPIVAIEFPYIG